MSLTRGDAYANSRRWLTSRRYSLYSDEGHLYPTAYFFGSLSEGIEEVRPDKQPSYPSRLEEGYSNKIKANSGVRFWRFHSSYTHLSVSGRVAHDALWGSFRLDAEWYPRLEHFLGRWMTCNNISFRERCKRFVTLYVMKLIAGAPQSQADTESRQSPTPRGYVSCGDKLMSGNAMERGA